MSTEEKMITMINNVNEHAKVCHSPEVWNKLDEKTKKEITKKEEMAKLMFTLALTKGMVKW